MKRKTTIELLNEIAVRDDASFYPEVIENSNQKPKNKDEIETIDYFLATKISNLEYKQNSVSGLFSERYVSELTTKFWNKSHDQRSKEDIKELHDWLQRYSNFEFQWKDYHRRAIFNSFTHNIADPQLNKAQIGFFESMKLFRAGKHVDSQRPAQVRFTSRSAKSTKVLFQLIVTELKITVLEQLANADVETYQTIIDGFVRNEIIFDTAVKQIIKSAHEELLNDSNEMFYDIGVSVRRTTIQYLLQRVLLLVLLNGVINYAQEKSIIKDEIAISNIQESIKRFIENNEASYQTHKTENGYYAWGSHCDDCMYILESLASNGLFSSKLKKKLNNKEIIFYTLPQCLEVEVVKSLKIPNLVRPYKLTKSGVDSLIKPLRSGEGGVTKTDHLVEALNISRQKKFRVNSKFLYFCKEMMYSDKYADADELDLGFSTPKEVNSISKLREENQSFINRLDNSYDNAVYNISSQCSKQYDFSFNNLGIIYDILGCPSIQKKFAQERKRLDIDYKSALTSNNFARSRMALAYVLQGFCLYITDSMCLRLRLYPTEFWIARTSGSLKYLTCDYSARKLTTIGHINLLRAFYTGYPELEQSFETFLNKHERTGKKPVINKKLLDSFFKENLPENLPSKNSLLYANLYLSLFEQSASSKGYRKTAVNVEIDQSASALVFLSFVLRDKRMAKVSNVLGGPKASPYKYMMEQFSSYYAANKDKFPFNKKAYDFLCSNQKLHKYAIMCFCYGQSHMGRMDDFYERWYKEMGYYPIEAEREFLKKFALMYSDFVDTVFPNATKKLNILKEVMDIMVKDSSQHEIKTPTGEFIRWVFFLNRSTIRKYYDVGTNSTRSYRLSIVGEDKRIDMPGMRTKLLSYFIHSIDSAVLRSLIVRMKNDYGISVNHLHDCVLVHPNDVDKLFEAIDKVYKELNLYHVTENMLFSVVQSSVSPESEKIIIGLKEDYYSMCESFEDELCHFNPRHMYKFEQ